MGNYSRPKQSFDRHRPWKFCTAALVLAAGCAGRPLGEQPPSPAVEAPPPMDAPASAPVIRSEPVALRPQAPAVYVVKKGDTLWDIAQHYLLDPWQWPEIWYVNEQLRNPHHLYPGDVLRLTVVDGRTRVALDVERRSPQLRASPLEDAIPTIPIDALRDFLRGPQLVTPEQLRGAPYLLAMVENNLIGAEGNLIYIRRLPAGAPYNYALLRAGAPYRDPDDGQIIGYETEPVADVEVKEYGEPAIGLIARSQREALVGDRLLLVQQQAPPGDFYPHAPGGPVGGRIIAAFDGVSQISQFQIVAINRGRRHGLERGHVLQILQSGRKAEDPYGGQPVQLPDQPAGQLLVFETHDRLSYGLVMTVTRPAHVMDKVEKPRPTR